MTYESIPSGYEWHYRCSRCAHEFVVLGNGQFLWSAIGVAGFGWFAHSFLSEPVTGALRWSPLGAFLAACAVGLSLQSIVRLRQRFITRPASISDQGITVR